MAVLQKIRNKAGVFVIIFVGVALFLFIVDPTTFQMLFQRQNTTIAKINKKKVDYSEYQEFYNYHHNYWTIRQGANSVNPEEEEMLRSQAWNDILQEYLFAPYIKEVGINVSDEELEDMLYGKNIHPSIYQSFTNPETGVMDTAMARNYFLNAEYDQRSFIIAEYLKDQLRSDRASTKYNNMISKGFYTPKAFAEMDYYEKNNFYDSEYIVKHYTDIPDENVQVSDTELKKYYDEHKYRFSAPKEVREVTYVVFDIAPSQEDTLTIKNEINELYKEFNELTDGHVEFARRYNDSEKSFPETFISQNELPNGLPEDFFDSQIGTTSDIILDYNTYFFTHIADIAQRPDSVRISQIVFLPNDTVTIEECIRKADSLKNLASNEEDFSVLAYFNSDDENSKTEGGDLGWFTEKELGNPEVLNLVFPANVGDVNVYKTDFAVFLIKVTDQTEKHRKVKIASVNKIIRPSMQTENKRFGEASAFAANNHTEALFDKAITDQNLSKRIAEVGELDNRVNNLQNARAIVKWAFEKDMQLGTVSDVFDFSDKYVIAKLSGITHKGTLPFEKAKEQIQPIVIKDKKAETIISEFNKNINSDSNLQTYADNADNLKVNTINRVSFGSFSIPGIGIEPILNAVISNIDMNKNSQPLKGNNGVYVVRVTNNTPATEKSDYSAEQLNLMRNSAGQIYRLNEALEKRAKVEDYRVNFF